MFKELPRETVLNMNQEDLTKYVDEKFAHKVPEEGNFDFCSDREVLIDYYQAVIETPGAKEWLKKTPTKEMIQHQMYLDIEKKRKLDDLSGLVFWCTVVNVKFIAEHGWLRFLGIMNCPSCYE